MLYFTVTITPELLNLSHAQLSLYINLLYLNHKYCGSGRTDHFFITDRSLATQAHCSTRTVYSTKKYLKKIQLIDYWIGNGNVSSYKILR
jgi:hypothetical protein